MTTTDQKLDAIYNKVNAIEVNLAVAVTYQKVHDEKIKKHEGKIDTLEASRNQEIGKRTVWATFFGLVGGAIMWLIKHLSTNQ